MMQNRNRLGIWLSGCSLVVIPLWGLAQGAGDAERAGPAPAGPAEEAFTSSADPLGSFMWELYRERYLGDAPYVFDSRVRLSAPGFAEDSGQVPLDIDAGELGDDFERMLAWVELNPIPLIFDYDPRSHGLPRLSLNVRLEQASPVRVAVQRHGVWHIGSTHIEAEGGGCTTPGIATTESRWEERFGEVAGRRFDHGEQSQLRLRVMHPMDSGLIPSQPAFHIQRFEVLDAGGELISTLAIEASVSENPALGLHMKPLEGGYRVGARDNNGNRFSIAL
ncbi:quinoprotein dehydrogenase-associated SoxYZ-like carrier [Halomonas mongoliensis]|uniref:quinoprotein dehydrogenase-associated SoxYZ-like carrier n=1 Tax=Halomonas mongoliensis TaxID=321265 RepID=UPI00403ACD46